LDNQNQIKSCRLGNYAVHVTGLNPPCFILDLFEECLSSRNLKEGREAGFESGSGQKAQKSLFGTEDYDEGESRASAILD
jgi:hypothetical protein